MKKQFIVWFLLICLLNITACGGGTGTKTQETTQAPEATTETTESATTYEAAGYSFEIPENWIQSKAQNGTAFWTDYHGGYFEIYYVSQYTNSISDESERQEWKNSWAKTYENYEFIAEKKLAEEKYLIQFQHGKNNELFSQIVVYNVYSGQGMAHFMVDTSLTGGDRNLYDETFMNIMASMKEIGEPASSATDN